ncbi:MULTISPECIES: CitMHS family transporter [unclassified Pseudomonas]|uniref:CitMHS family transporter n=1 Tax=unclassified Pseudomonas TaxID=196821 RepID=UPI0017854A88|nr:MULTISPECIES: citrate:proton symporter [unclassified Pseudomonas]MBD8593973.1 TRAP transporter large permease subunit [Pseudomonas sp. CFBP 8758]MBD8603522.1 TRAP transporter large permease subunit [Pseudomonas sp. CFBP 8771]MBD8623515.1 TRAP transporter large permease subunit [Pseudomonas sp. CFBP 13727]MBD8826466.1 TRAP transporter large permease subunit [Pseudomonas sp. CFBP 13602]
MLALLGLAMVVVFTYLIMSKRLSPIVALTVVPIVFAVIGGFGGSTGKMILDGLKVVAPSAALLLFAILFFGLMIDSGLFDPLIRKILKKVNGDPVKIAIGTALLSLTVALDGDGTTTYMITCAAMLPLYKRIGMNPMVLATVAMLALGIMSGMSPWGGPATRAIAVLGIDASEYFIPLLPTMAGGAAWVVFTAYLLGRAERKRIGSVQLQSGGGECYIEAILGDQPYKRPKLVWINLLLVIGVMVALVMGLAHSAVLFLIGFVLALMINYPQLDIQKERILAHSGNAMTVVLLVFAAGVFAGIFSGTKMVDALAQSLVDMIPPSWGHLFPLVVAVTSMPLTFVLSNDAYYFGVVPILANAAAAYGISPVEIARASILGQPVHLMSPLVASTLLLVGMVDRDIGDFQKATVKWAVLTSLVVTALALLTGAITLFA